MKKEISVGRFEFTIWQRIFRKRLALNFIPMFSAIDVCDDNNFDLILYRWYTFNWLTLVIDVMVPANRNFHKKLITFPHFRFLK